MKRFGLFHSYMELTLGWASPPSTSSSVALHFRLSTPFLTATLTASIPALVLGTDVKHRLDVSTPEDEKSTSIRAAACRQSVPRSRWQAEP